MKLISKPLNFIIVLISILLLSGFNYAQNELKEKIKNIKGDVDKITITANGTTHTFEGEQAKELFKKMQKSSTSHSYVMDINDEDGEKTIVFINSDGEKEIIDIDDDDDLVWESEDGEFEKMEKKINVEIEDGQKKVTVTTNENGEEKTEVYEGEEAEKYLEEMKSKNGNSFEFKFDEDDESGKKVRKIKIEKKTEKEK